MVISSAEGGRHEPESPTGIDGPPRRTGWHIARNDHGSRRGDSPILGLFDNFQIDPDSHAIYKDGALVDELLRSNSIVDE